MAVKEAFGISQQELVRAGYVPEQVSPDQGYAYRPFTGIGDLRSFLTLASTSGEYRPRGDQLETDETFGQLIMYAFELRPDGTFFMYQRGGIEQYDESRLAGKVSVGIGGHMERTDLSFAQSFKREFAEEASPVAGDVAVPLMGEAGPDLANIRRLYQIQPRGVLRDVRKPVDRVHVGVVTRLIPRDPELTLRIIENGENVASSYVTAEEYLEMVHSGRIEPESWTDAVFREEIVPLLAEEQGRVVDLS